MELINLLETALPIIGQTFDVSLDWMGQLVRLIISGFSVVGVGVIVFSLLLKVIMLPVDIYQRISMRKQNLKMKEQKERMEKLQKQYANNQELYNKKVAEMYKESGISMFSSCLPMILTIAIFMYAIGGFNAYSQYDNIQNYNTMVQAYNAKIESYCADLTEANFSFEEGKIVVTGGADDYIYYKVGAGEYNESTDVATLRAYVGACKDKTYFIDVTKAATIEEISQNVTAEMKLEDVAYTYFVGEAQNAVLEVYNNTVSKNTSFLWIKNIWATDAAHVHPLRTYTDFQTSAMQQKFDVNGEAVTYGEMQEKAGTRVYTEEVYNHVTAKLTTAKEEPNGFYVLIALSMLTILLHQFVTMRSQKEQNQFSTVDGQGESSQKMMMFMMTAMFAVFSFMYSSAFALYMVVSNLFSLASTLVINKFVDRSVEKKTEKQTMEKMDNRGLSRIEAAKNAGKASAKESREKKEEKKEESKE